MSCHPIFLSCTVQNKWELFTGRLQHMLVFLMSLVDVLVAVSCVALVGHHK